MKPLGIVLLFINLLAAGGVAYLATQSWAKKQEQNTAVVKLELTASGLPTKKTANDRALDTLKADESVKLYNRDLRVQVLKDHFGQVQRGGDYAQMSANPPLSLVAEVEDMKKQIDTKLTGLPNPQAQLEYLVGTMNRTNPNRLEPGVLTLLADDVEERIAFRAWLAEIQQNPQSPNAAALAALARSALDAKFDLALADPDPAKSTAFEAAKRKTRNDRDTAFDTYQKAAKGPGQDNLRQAYLEAQLAYWKALAAAGAEKPASLSDADRRLRAAGLLAVLDPSPVGQKRTALLAGLPDYTAAVLDRTQRLTSMPERYERQGESELDTFTLVYKQKLKTSTDLDFMLQRQTDITKTFAAQERAAAAQVQTRTKHRDDAQGRVDDLDKRVKAASAAQQALEKEIFDLQKLVGARFDELFQLEDQVFRAEKQKGK